MALAAQITKLNLIQSGSALSLSVPFRNSEICIHLLCIFLTIHHESNGRLSEEREEFTKKEHVAGNVRHISNHELFLDWKLIRGICILQKNHKAKFYIIRMIH